MALDKKMLLLFPPQWTPISPHYAVIALMGQLKSKNYNAAAMDLNIDFYNNILKKEKLVQSIEIAKARFEFLRQEVKEIVKPYKKAIDYSFEEQISIYSYNYIKGYFNNKGNYLNAIPNIAEEAVSVLKSEKFYDIKELVKSINIVDKALDIISLPYTPTKLNFDSVINPFFKFNLDNIIYFVKDKKSNMFIDYYNAKLNEILSHNADMVAVSINSSSQIVAGLTLTKLLKEKTKAHINIGGNFFGRIADELLKYKNFFEIFADSVSVEEGEGPIVEMAKYVNGEIPIEQVPNLVYIKDDKVLKNENMVPAKLNNVAPLYLDDYNKSLYFTPKLVMPFQSSRGCYWGKCSFCDQDFGQNFNVKDVENVIKEMKLYKDKYDITDFEFIDESVSPVYLKELSKRLIEENLNVRFFFDARLESAFTKDILTQGYNAGLRMIMWGLESGSLKIMEMINKGIDLDRRFEILKDSKEAGIWNFAFIFFGFPTETKKDAKLTIKMLVENKDIIHSYGRSVFTMGRHSKLAEDPVKYGITKIYPAEEDFSPNINFDSVGSTKQELKEILEECKKECSIAYKNPLWMYLRYREWLYLYIERYGCDYVKDYNVVREWSKE